MRVQALLAVGTGLLAAASCASCGSAASPASSSSSSSSATAATPLLDGMVAIDDDRSIRATCDGFDKPGPVVVLVSGSRSAGDEWRAQPKAGAAGLTLADLEEGPSSVFGQVSAFAPVCSYDRPGTVRLSGLVSSTTRVDQPTTAMEGVADLEAWLKAAQVAPPYVLVGHSWGGMIATLFAATYPSQTAGLVLVDPASVYLQDSLSADQWQAFLDVAAALDAASGAEVPDYASTVGTVRAAQVPSVPAVVLTSDEPFDFGAGPGTWDAWLAAADRIAEQLDAEHITQTDSGHIIPVEQPALVADAIRRVHDQA